ncbi:uncharacterized protein LOC135392022 [Ornithodoros turicata]|uniref:uncharacterized protein LOC135392022 n=1 Tax=Ornithodoros turicata TaxID=34597 RepID=UPI003139DBF4
MLSDHGCISVTTALELLRCGRPSPVSWLSSAQRRDVTLSWVGTNTVSQQDINVPGCWQHLWKLQCKASEGSSCAIRGPSTSTADWSTFAGTPPTSATWTTDSPDVDQPRSLQLTASVQTSRQFG